MRGEACNWPATLNNQLANQPTNPQRYNVEEPSKGTPPRVQLTSQPYFQRTYFQRTDQHLQHLASYLTVQTPHTSISHPFQVDQIRGESPHGETRHDDCNNDHCIIATTSIAYFQVDQIQECPVLMEKRCMPSPARRRIYMYKYMYVP